MAKAKTTKDRAKRKVRPSDLRAVSAPFVDLLIRVGIAPAKLDLVLAKHFKGQVHPTRDDLVRAWHVVQMVDGLLLSDAMTRDDSKQLERVHDDLAGLTAQSRLARAVHVIETARAVLDAPPQTRIHCSRNHVFDVALGDLVRLDSRLRAATTADLTPLFDEAPQPLLRADAARILIRFAVPFGAFGFDIREGESTAAAEKRLLGRMKTFASRTLGAPTSRGKRRPAARK